MSQLTPKINTMINLGDGLAGAGFSFAQLLQIVGDEELQAVLPYWGLVQGFLRIANSMEDLLIKGERISPKAPKLCTAGNILLIATNANLVFQSAQALATGTAELVPFGFAITAGAEFLMAATALTKQIGNYHKLVFTKDSQALDYEKRKIYKHSIHLACRLLTVIAWMAIASGNPIGWTLLAITSLQRLYAVKSSYACRGLFGHSQTSEHHADNTTMNQTVNTFNPSTRL